jgi:pre-mRNA-splicing factor CWC22
MPSARLRALQVAAAQDRRSAEYRRLPWDALRKSITGIVNRANVRSIKHVVFDFFSENLIRSRRLFARSTMKAQAAGLPFAPRLCSPRLILSTKLPMMGEIPHRLISQFRRVFKRDDKVRLRIVVCYPINSYHVSRPFAIVQQYSSHPSSTKTLRTS